MTGIREWRPEVFYIRVEPVFDAHFVASGK